VSRWLICRPHLDEAFIILDEAQNTTPEQMKMFLTAWDSIPVP
jgi:phosphate starvation-inducible protein PhoH